MSGTGTNAGYNASSGKRKKISPTTLFLREYRGLNSRYSGCPINDPELVAEAMEAYRFLPPEELEKLRLLAREENAAASTDAKGNSVSAASQLLVPTAAQSASEQISKLIDSIGSLPDWPIVFAGVSVHLKPTPTYNAPVLPAELALVSFSLRHGVAASVHILPSIAYEDVPMGLMSECRAISNGTHQVPIKCQFAQSDWTDICDRLESVLLNHPGDQPVRVFAPRDSLSDFVGAIDWLYARAGRAPPANIRQPLPVEVLLRCLAEHLGNPCVVIDNSCNLPIIGEHVATRKLATSRYNYASKHACEHHNQIDCPWLCTLHRAHVAAWVFSTEFCPALKLSITAKHLPTDPPLQVQAVPFFAMQSGGAGRGGQPLPPPAHPRPPNLPPGPDTVPLARSFAFGRGSVGFAAQAKRAELSPPSPPSPSTSSTTSSSSVNVFWRADQHRPALAADAAAIGTASAWSSRLSSSVGSAGASASGRGRGGRGGGSLGSTASRRGGNGPAIFVD